MSLEFIATARPNRPDFLATITPEEKAVMGEHLAYAGRLFQEGKILFGGAATDGSIGILVYTTDSEEEARRLFDEDPLVRSKIAVMEFHPFRVGVMAGERRAGG